MVKIGRQKNLPNTLVSAASVRWRMLAEKVYSLGVFDVAVHISLSLASFTHVCKLSVSVSYVGRLSQV